MFDEYIHKCLKKRLRAVEHMNKKNGEMYAKSGFSTAE